MYVMYVNPTPSEYQVEAWIDYLELFSIITEHAAMIIFLELPSSLTQSLFAAITLPVTTMTVIDNTSPPHRTGSI